jgi:hypothetical protein
MASERMLVLASSRKPGGRCIAGLSLSRHGLVRPVTEGSGAISLYDCGLEVYPQEFDIVTFEHRGHDGDVAQPENVLVDGSPWTVEQPMAREDALALLEVLRHPGDVIFGNRGKAVPEHIAASGMSESLCLVEPDEVEFRLTYFNKPRAVFECGDAQWDLGLTDLRVRPQLLRQEPGVYSLADLGFDQASRVMLLLSLGTVFDGYHYKLAAAVLDFA